MPNSSMENPSSGSPERIEISLPELAKIVWAGRWLIIGITLLAMVATFAYVSTNKKYLSEGLYQFGGPIPLNPLEGDGVSLPDPKRYAESFQAPPVQNGVSLSDYKRYAESFQTPERFEQYVKALGLKDSPGITNLNNIFNSVSGISKQVEPLHSFTQADAKTLFAPKEVGNNILGLRISLADPNPLAAQQMVSLLGRYVMDVLVYDVYADRLLTEVGAAAARSTEIDNQLLDNKVKSDELKRKEQVLQNIVKKSPAASDIKSQSSIISVDEKTITYLPASTQLVATELQISQLAEQSNRFLREKKQLELRKEYYEAAMEMHERVKSGEIFLNTLPATIKAVFKDKEMSNDDVKEVYNGIMIGLQKANNLYAKRSRFVAGPVLPSHPAGRKGYALLIALVAGFCFSVLLVLGRQWLRDTFRSDVS